MYSSNSWNFSNNSFSVSVCTFQNFIFLPSKKVYAPIIGFKPLTRFFISFAVLFFQSIFAISLDSIGAIVPSSGCLVLVAVPFSISFTVFINRFAPIIFNLFHNSPVVSSSPISTSSFNIMSPVSIPAFINIVVTPVFLSPFSTAHWIGAAPLYSGNNEPWTFTQPYFGISNNSCGKIFPYATTQIKSGFSFFTSSKNSGLFLTFIGW